MPSPRGADLPPTETIRLPTKDATEGVAAPPVRSPRDSRIEGRFPPGTLLANRYRIAGLLGKGGMGEVYRAYDLTLEQPVALKFLREASAVNPAAMARFRNEVRIARQVSHANVCRVYDIGQVRAQAYISMEYVDGEDLSSLIRRIGRLPPDKGVEIARRLCGGLAAAHERGVLHRDLKPSNIMIDGRGRALITDFGLACFAEQLPGSEVSHGTPSYMAPEQLSGKEVSVRSDIYSLGLVLYEMFTGKRVFQANSLAELLRLHENMLLTSPAFLVKDLDPAIERLILSCLDPDPNNRPYSALAVSAALPGGDPLGAALAAGETPSPETVAAEGGLAGLSPRVAGWCMASVVIGLVAVAFLSTKVSLIEKGLLGRTPDVLVQKARDILQIIGYTYRPMDSAYGLRYDANPYFRYVEQHDLSSKRWSHLVAQQPPLIHFWYCQSPRYLDPSSLFTGSLGPMRVVSVAATVNAFDAAAVVPGLLRIKLDPLGHLLYLSAVPSQVGKSPDRSLPFDWSELFTAAGLNQGMFSPVQPQWTPPAAFDTRAAWIGTYAERPDFSLRVEAAAWRGRPVFFQITGPWNDPDGTESSPVPRREGTTRVLWYTLVVFVVVGASFLARHNIRSGRGDRRGSFRLAVFVFSAYMLSWLLMSHHVPTQTELTTLMTAASQAAFVAGGLWLIYIALEPYVRRHWPHTIVSWSRILVGRVRDPLVGADLLFGVIAGTAWTLVIQSHEIVRQSLGEAAWWTPSLDALLGVRQFLGRLLMYLPQAIMNSLAILFTILVLRILVRRQWLAGGISVVLLALVTLDSTRGVSRALVGMPFWLVFYAGVVFILMRFGLLSLTTGLFVIYVLRSFPITADLSAWYAETSLFVLVSVFALSVYGLHASVARRPLLKDALLSYR